MPTTSWGLRAERYGDAGGAKVGTVALVGDLPGFAVIDAAGKPISAISDFLNTTFASGARPGSVRSYSLALLR